MMFSRHPAAIKMETVAHSTKLTSKGTLSRWRVLPDKGQKLVFGLFQGDVAVFDSLNQSWLLQTRQQSREHNSIHFHWCWNACRLNLERYNLRVLVSTFPWCSLHHSDIPSSSSSGCLMITVGPYQAAATQFTSHIEPKLFHTAGVSLDYLCYDVQIRVGDDARHFNDLVFFHI